MTEDLKQLLTPELFHNILDARIPFPSDEKLDFAHVYQATFRQNEFAAKVGDRIWDALIAMSKIGLENMPDLTSFLPSPSDADFPRQALGLQLLVDQGPRFLFDGVDERWTNAYFDTISLKYAQALEALPEQEKPSSWARWKDSATLDYWVIVRTWFVAPFVHADLPESQEQAAAISEETRRVVEAETGTTDPHRAKRPEILSDIYGFLRVAMAGLSKEESTLQGYAYWMCMLMDIHKPIVDKFGHYPYRNAFFGRKDTPEEVTWMEKQNNFGAPSAETAEKIKQDMKAGVWTPLGRGRQASA